MNPTNCRPRHKKSRAKAAFIRWTMLAALLPGTVLMSGCRHPTPSAASQAAHAGDANQQALRQSRDILSRRSATLRAKRAQSASKMPSK